ncbi:MAG TPA: energy-coupling factor transporter transmembrane component T [Kiritimatiellia bacterium]|jgi:energy-coupling factor transporter transmembrane protein EcfT|nr:energy-coupling factor transporter transmembrane component T [Kiritimatiellia bacterium]
MIAFSEAFGGGNGAARRLAPAVRLLCGAWVFVCCAVVPLGSPAGIALFVVAWLAWLLGCAMPPRQLALSLGFAICLFAPLLLLAPVARWNGSAVTWTEALRAPLYVGARGVAGVTICVGALSLLPFTEFTDAVAALPLPRAVTGLLVQIVHQAALLTDETRRMADAMRVRGASSARLAMRLRVVTAFPANWMTRLALRAARAGDAMEVRGFDGLPPNMPTPTFSRSDWLALTATTLLAVGALALRWRGCA